MKLNESNFMNKTNQNIAKKFIHSIFIEKNIKEILPLLSKSAILIDNTNENRDSIILDSSTSINSFILENYILTNLNYDFNNLKFEISKLINNTYEISTIAQSNNNSDSNKNYSLAIAIQTNIKENNNYLITNINISIKNKIINSIGGSISFSIDDNFTIHYVSNSLAEKLGYCDKYQMLNDCNSHFINALNICDINILNEYLTKSLKNHNEIKVDIKVKNSNSNYINLTFIGHIISINNGKFDVLATLFDYEQLNEYENPLKIMQSDFSNMIQSYDLPIFLKDKNGIYIAANVSFMNLMKIPNCTEIKGKKDSDLFIEKESNENLYSDKIILTGKQQYIVTHSSIMMPNNKSYYSSYKVPCYNKDKIYGLLGVIYNTSEKLKILATPDQKEIETNFILENSDNSYYVKDEKGKILIINDSLYKLFNISKKDAIGKTNEDLFLPDLCNIINRYEHIAITTKHKITIGHSIIKEYLKKLDNGNFYDVTITPILNKEGSVHRLIGSFNDVTKILNQEKKLNKNYNETIDLLSSTSTLSYLRIDLQTEKIVFLNQEGKIVNTDNLYYNTERLSKFQEIFVYKSDYQDFMDKFSFKTLKENYNKRKKIRAHYLLSKHDNNFTQVDFNVDYNVNPISEHKEAILYLIDNTDTFVTQELLEHFAKNEYDFILILSTLIDKVNIIEFDKKEYDFTKTKQNPSIENFLRVLYQNSTEKGPTINEWIKKLEAKTNDKDETSYRIETKDNKQKNIIIKTLNKSKKSYFILCTDITKLVQKDKEIQTKLKKLADEANEANNINSDFIARMSHDMRTPLTAILGLSDFGIDECTDENLRTYFTKIKSSGQYLFTLLSDILNIHKLKKNELQLNTKPFDFQNCYQDIITIISPRLNEKKIKFTHKQLNKSPKFTKGDENRIKEILINILSNSVKYTQIQGKLTWICAYIDNSKPFVRHIISDNGIGMSEEFQKIMFHQFSQEKNIFSKKEGGSGLGLSIVNELLTLMGGSISCKSKLQEGTTITIEIPLEIPSRKEIDNLLMNKNYEDLKNLNNKNVLLCEDAQLNRMIIKKILSKYRIKVDMAENGKIGVHKAKHNKYDAILMDIKMPILNGLESTTMIRQFDKSTPIIALSGNAYKEDIKKSLEVGMNAHIKKPINNEELYRTLAIYINHNFNRTNPIKIYD